MSISSSRTLRNVSREEAFYFFTSIANYTGMNAASLDEFLLRIKEVDVKSLEFHLYREDFEKWVTQTLGDDKIAKDIKRLRDTKIVGDAVRDGLYFIVSRRLKELKASQRGWKETKVKKRDGRIQDYIESKIIAGVKKTGATAKEAEEVAKEAAKKLANRAEVTAEELSEIVVTALRKVNKKASEAFVKFRDNKLKTKKK